MNKLDRRTFVRAGGYVVAGGVLASLPAACAVLPEQPAVPPGHIGDPLNRLDGPAKVTGTATYAMEHPVARPLYVYPVQATICTGRVERIDTAAAASVPGVLAVLTHDNAPRLPANADPNLRMLQQPQVLYRGQIIGAVIAETPEVARHAAGLVQPSYQASPHNVAFRPDTAALYTPRVLNAGYVTDTTRGDADAALRAAAVRLDATYTTPTQHANPLEPHSTMATWTPDELRLHTSTQGGHALRTRFAPSLGLAPERIRIIAPHVGGGFGSKVAPHPEVMLAALAAQHLPGRSVKLALTRQQMFTQVGHRTPTHQRIQLGADTAGRLTAIVHDVIEQTAAHREFAEQTASVTRRMYAAANARTTHRLAALNTPVPTYLRAPGVTPGMFALESAMDEMAIACRLDPVEFRIRNEPATDPESGLPFSSRNLVTCLREGARRFGWAGRDPATRARREHGWLVGTGVAASSYPVHTLGASTATIRAQPGPDGRLRYAVRIAAADIGTGAWTALAQIAATALAVPAAVVDLAIGDTALPEATPAGGSTGTTSWGSAITQAAVELRAELDRRGGRVPPDGLEITARSPAVHPGRFSMHSFGAQFAEVRVHEDTGEIRVPRLLGVFAAGRVINPKTARSQMIGGMTWGLSMALHENSHVDPRYGHVINHDLAGYHIAVNADIESLEAHFIPEEDPHINALGAKGVGELGITGTAAAIANAAHHATGIRVRDLPITLDRFLT